MPNDTTFGLPPVATFRMVSQHTNGWSDNYGAIRVAAAYAGYPLGEPYYIRGVWHHGCFGPWEAYTPHMLACNAPGAQQVPILTARAEEAEFLRANGYPHARAIGLPILYAPASGLPRIPRSLLVMPGHTLLGHTFADRAPFRAYAREIAQIAPQFDRVVVCIHPSCRENGLWIEEFKAEGLEMIEGASVNDLNSLARMRSLFEQFETVTTNGWGSHVAYALAFGAKVSIHGTFPALSEENLLKDTAWAADRSALKLALSADTKKKEKAFLKKFLVPPPAAEADRALGEWLVGADHRLSPEAMKSQLGSVVDGPVTGHEAKRRILFITHEASRTGAPMFLLHFLRWLRAETSQQFDVLSLRPGPLVAEFSKVAHVYSGPSLAEVLTGQRDYGLVYANSACSGDALHQIAGLKLPVISHVHELDFAYDLIGPIRMGHLLGHSSSLIACATVIGERLRARYGIPGEQISVHHEMIGVKELLDRAETSKADECRQRLALPAKARVVVGCGTQDLRKGTDIFLQLAARLKRKAPAGECWRFVWVGAPSSVEFSKILENDIRRLGIAADVLFVGEQANPHALMNLADVFCLTSREDPFPLAMLEAAALGKPVVAFDGAGGAREFCDLGGGITVPYLDTEAMADACQELLADAPRARETGERAARLVRARFDVSVIAPVLWQDIQARAPALAARSQTLAEVFSQWSPETDGQTAYVSMHLARDQACRQARRHVAAGRSKEAVAILSKSVSAALATKDIVIIVECLIECGREMCAFDPARAASLLQQGERFLANVPSSSDVGRYFRRELASAQSMIQPLSKVA